MNRLASAMIQGTIEICHGPFVFFKILLHRLQFVCSLSNSCHVCVRVHACVNSQPLTLAAHAICCSRDRKKKC